MARQKVKMAYIENGAARKSTFKKRKRGLFKKAYELRTLCDVPIGLVVKSEHDSTMEAWPSREDVEMVVSQWKMLSVMDRTKKMVNQETYLQQRISKATESWKKLWKENKELEMKEVMFDCLKGKASVTGMDKTDLRDFGCVIDQHLKDVNRRVEILMKNGESSSSAAAAAAAAAAVATTTSDVVVPVAEMGSSSAGFYDRIPDHIENSLNMKHTIKDLDLNQKQW